MYVMLKVYLRNMDRKVGAQQLAALPETVEGRNDGAGEQLVQDLLDEGLFGLGDGRLVAEVCHLPRTRKKSEFLKGSYKLSFCLSFPFLLNRSVK